MELIIFLVFSLLIHGALGEIACEDLSVGKCAYSVASSGKRCTLETYESSDGTTGYQCKTSEVVVAINGIANWIESDECISACGANRDSVGISSDYLLESSFISKLCSQECYQKCPNIVDLYYNLALGEGVYLPAFCKGKKLNGRREMSQIHSSGAATAPASDGYGGGYGRQLTEGPAASAGYGSEYDRQLTEGPTASAGYGGGYGRQLSEGPAESPAITFDDMEAVFLK